MSAYHRKCPSPLQACLRISGAFLVAEILVLFSWGTSNTVQTHHSPQCLPLPQEESPGIAIVTAVMDRSPQFRVAAKSWLQLVEVEEIIVVELVRPNEVSKLRIIIDELHDERVRLVVWSAQSHWVLTWAVNLAVMFSTKSKILKVDADTYVARADFFLHHTLNASVFYTGDWRTAKTENAKHLNGVVYMLRNQFLSIGGYDERITTYGWDDSALYECLQRLPCARLLLKDGFLYHIEHAISHRVSNQRGAHRSEVELHVNRLLAAVATPWGATQDRSQFCIRPVARQLYSAHLLRAPRSLKDSVSTQYLSMTYLRAAQVALRRFNVPWQRLRNRSQETLEALLELQTHKEPLLVVMVPTGLCNRLRTLASAVVVANSSQRKLVVVWEQNPHCEALWSELFRDSPFPLLSGVDTDDFRNTTSFDVYSYITNEYGSRRYQYINTSTSRHIFVKSGLVLNHTATIGLRQDMRSWLRALRPSDAVSQLMEPFLERIQDYIGVHIRSRLDDDLRGISNPKELYSPEVWSSLVKWRGASNVTFFKERLLAIRRSNPNQKFFVASDTRSILDHLREAFPPGVIQHIPRTCDFRDVSCVQTALADVLLLSKTSTIFGSYWSSFSDLAAFIGQQKLVHPGESAQSP